VIRHIDAWGRVRFHGSDAVELLMCGADLATLLIEPTDDIAAYNLACDRHDKAAYRIPAIIDPDHSPDTDTAQRINTWFIPPEYRARDMRQHLLALCRRPDEVARVNHEMALFEARGLVPVLQLMCYLVDHFRQHGIVWGIGRGSSVASYCLFLIGVSKIDPIAYDLPIEEFLR
jgi:DNA polymerase III alpha subunit